MGTIIFSTCSNASLANMWETFGESWPCLGEERNLGKL